MSFLCRLPDTKIAWINLLYVYTTHNENKQYNTTSITI